MIWVLPMIGLIVLEAVADYFAGGFARNGKMMWATLSILSYLLANVSWLFAIRNGSGLAKGAAIFALSSVLLGVSIGVLIYGEKLSSLQYGGISLGIIALIMILY